MFQLVQQLTGRTWWTDRLLTPCLAGYLAEPPILTAVFDSADEIDTPRADMRFRTEQELARVAGHVCAIAIDQHLIPGCAQRVQEYPVAARHTRFLKARVSLVQEQLEARTDWGNGQIGGWRQM